MHIIYAILFLFYLDDNSATLDLAKPFEKNFFQSHFPEGESKATELD